MMPCALNRCAKLVASCNRAAGVDFGRRQTNPLPKDDQAVERQLEARRLDGRGHVLQRLQAGGRLRAEKGKGQVKVLRHDLAPSRDLTVAPVRDCGGLFRRAGQGEEQPQHVVIGLHRIPLASSIQARLA
jgi:hypothetical protein